MTTEQTQASNAATDGAPRFRYNATLAAEIEARWQDRWESEGTFNAPNPSGPLAMPADQIAATLPKDKLYVLDMFPYPSGAGLHVGHPLGYIGTDVLGRFERMRGRNVLHTIGYDAFGLPAEQYAVRTGTHPRATTETNVARYRAQLRRLGFGHDQRRSVATTDVEFYRWTQWIFLQLFNSYYDVDTKRARPIDDLIGEFAAGARPTPGDVGWNELNSTAQQTILAQHRLAYISEAPVNWCPGLGTVLSNEEITPDGKSEIGNFPVFRRNLRQWMMRITSYADRLIEDLDRLDWPESVKAMQRNWIGRSVGARVSFAVAGTDQAIEVYTTRPDTLFGATYAVLAPEHPLVDVIAAAAWPEGTNEKWTGGAATPAEAIHHYREQASRKSDLDRQETKEKTGVFTGALAVNPVTRTRLPVFIADYVLMGYGTGAIMAVPSGDTRDHEFAVGFELPIIRTVQAPADFPDDEAYTGPGAIINSANDEISLDGLDIPEAKSRIIDHLMDKGAGRAEVQYRLRDWLFSRQRYWGEPFPIVYDENDQPIALPDEMLPLLLPETNDFTPKAFAPDDVDSPPEPPLGRLTDWVYVELDLGDGPKKYRRETNTMPNWAGSCWYELRYLDPANDESLVDPSVESYWMGPSAKRPLGGVDLYVGGVEHAVLHLLYSRFWHKVLFDLGYVTSAEPFHKLVNQGMLQLPAYTNADGFYVEASEVTEHDGGFFYQGEQVKQEFGKIGKSLKNVIAPDQFVAEFGTDTFRLFEMFSGPLDQSRPWDAKAIVGPYRLLQRLWRVVLDEQTGQPHVADIDVPDELNRLLHRTIHAVQQGYQTLRFNTSIARITELNNAVTQLYPTGGAPRAVAEAMVLMLAPLAPHIAEELWAKLGGTQSLAWQEFPVVDEALLVDDTVEVPVQINGKVRGVILVAADADADALEAAALADDKVVAALADRPVKRVIARTGKLVNFVV